MAGKLTDEKYLLSKGWKRLTLGKRRYLDPVTKKDKPIEHALVIQMDRDHKEQDEREAFWINFHETLDVDDKETFDKLFPPVKRIKNKESKNDSVRQSKARVQTNKQDNSSGSNTRKGRPRPKRTKGTKAGRTPRLLPKGSTRAPGKRSK